MHLYDRFLALPRPSQDGAFSVEQGTARWRVGKSFLGRPALLFSFDDVQSSAPPRRLMNVAYHPPAEVKIVSGDGSARAARVAVLECLSADRELCEYFLRVAASMLPEPASATEAQFERALSAVIALFRKLEQPAARSVQGLWAELVLIQWARDPEGAIASWHSSPTQLHDFASGVHRLEMKSTSKGLREHSFSLEQLRLAVTTGCTLIGSMMMQERGDGATVFDLVEAIGKRVTIPDLVARVESIVAETLGVSWREAHAMRFGIAGARESFRLYRAEDVPTVPQPLPAQVKNVRFDVDVSGLAPLDMPDARAMGALFAGLLPA